MRYVTFLAVVTPGYGARPAVPQSSSAAYPVFPPVHLISSETGWTFLPY
jgi:hypothetical protein